MNRYLFDTNVISELGKPKPAAGVLQLLAQQQPAWLSVITVHEARFGVERVRDKHHRQRLKAWFLPMMERFKQYILPCDEACALRAA